MLRVEKCGYRTKRVSLSPALIRFIAPHGKLYQKLLIVEQLPGSIPTIIVPQRHTKAAYLRKTG